MADWALVLGVCASVALAVAVGMLVIAAFPLSRGVDDSVFSAQEEETVFLFDGDTLVDATPSARALLARADLRGPPLVRLMAFLDRGFPGVEDRLARLAGEGAFTLTSVPAHGTALMLQAEFLGGLMRIVLRDTGTPAGLAGPDPMHHRAIADELDQLRRIAAGAPLPVWRERADGAVIWANGDYLARAAELLPPGEELTWPIPRLFERGATSDTSGGQRQRLQRPGGASPLWFDLTVVPDGDARLLYALPADATVQAELSLRDFMQTLTQTFAHLPIGLAIFDRGRQLHMFNPALLDLTGLPVDFLSRRPTLQAVLDALRESRMLPEPKDYLDWRRQMTEMERAAAAGLYEEMWSLPGGQTYRVMARPHPNGGLAMMIEDVSTETLRTRRYRADLELSQSVVDAMDEAVAVFAQDGQVVMTNAAYGRLWGDDPAAALGDGAFGRFCGQWRAASAPTPVWSRADAFVAMAGEREPWVDEVRLTDGRLLHCRFAALPAGATLVAFGLAEPARPAPADGLAHRPRPRQRA